MIPNLFRGLLALGLAAVMFNSQAQAGDKVRIALAGDSTVTTNAGWGTGFALCLNDRAECLNFARGGASTKSYYDAKLWQKVIDAKPDYVLIQFGHNDMPGKGANRETDPATTYRENLIRYLTTARAIGAKPILVTSLTRRHFEPDGKIKSDLLAYVEAAKKVAQDQNVPLIDLHAHSIELCNQLGPEGCKGISPIDAKTGKIDSTHLNAKGGQAVGQLVAKELAKVVPPLAPCIKP